MSPASPSIVDRTVVPSGRLGMWLFLSSEIATFGGLIAVYLLLRLRHPEWIVHSSRTLLPVGALNTFVLLTSSLTMVLAHASSVEGDRAGAVRWLLSTMLLGALFLGVKGFEYRYEIHHGNGPTAGVFWTFYFAMTGLHGLHVLAGIAILGLVAAGLRNPARLSRVAPAGLYWHFVDLVWIFLFPLLYVTTH